LSAAADIDRLHDQGQWPAALAAAQQLLAQAEIGGEDAYPAAAYDLAVIHFRLGRVLLSRGAAEDALTPLRKARRLLQQLAATGDSYANGMAGKALSEIGHCLLLLGRWDQAAAAYQEAAAHATRLGDDRAAAVANGQLATVRLQQGRYPEALAGYTTAREVFQKLGEPATVAGIWHQIGMVHQAAGRFEAAEQAYQHSLALRVQQNKQTGQADTLTQLGNLYDQRGRLEEAVGFYRQAVDVDVRSGDHANEGKDRNNLAFTLLRLGRHDEARAELHRALDCGKPYGHASEPWKTWEILEQLEQATGHPDTAHTARHQAIASYLAYRHAGGGSQNSAIRLFNRVGRAIAEHTPDQAIRELADRLRPDTPPRTTALVHALQALLASDPVPARIDHPDLHSRDVAELHLLASLVEASPETTDG
jgi:tetratricopeptide (TPR) repeat protein